MDRGTGDATRPALPLSPVRRRVVTLGLLLGMALGAVEATVVATAMPTVIARLGGLEHFSWVFSAYLLASTASVPVWGRLSDLRGRRRLYLIGTAIFVVGSTLAGASQSMLQLVLSRAIQGLGAGAIVPLSLTIIGEIYTLQERARMQAVFSGVWGVASIAGPLLGGYITDTLSWRWIFLINIPLGVLAGLVVARALPEAWAARAHRVDWTGAALLTGAITALLIGLSDVGGPRSPWFLASLAFAVGLGMAYRRTAHPILPFALLSQRLISLSNTVAFLVGMALFGAVAFVPLFVQATQGVSATRAGQVLTPLFLGWVTTSIIGVRMMLRVGYRITAQVGVGLVTASFLGLAWFADGARSGTLMGIMGLLGCGMGLSMMSLLLHVQRTVGRAELGLATSLNQFSRSIGGAVGVAAMGAILAAGMAERGGLHLESMQGSRLLLDPSSREALTRALRHVFAAGALMSLAGFFFALALPEQPPTTSEVSSGAGEHLLAAEMTTLDADEEPRGVS
jgi:EmrB/QacA subfamily drug resistance transporter